MKLSILLLISLSFLHFSCVSNGPSTCTVKSNVFGDNKVEVSERLPKNSQGLILVMPPTGGSNFLDRQYASDLCQKGFTSVIVERWQGLGTESLDIHIHQKLLTKAQEAIDTVLAQYESSFVGIVGTSVGALHGATALGQHKDLDAGFFIAGGGPMHKVIATSDESTLQKYRKKRLKKYGFKNVEDYAQAIDGILSEDLDALNFKESIMKKPLALVVANEDTTVLTEYQKNWVKAFNPKELYEFDSSHFWSILKTWWFHEHKVTEFFLHHSKQIGNEG